MTGKILLNFISLMSTQVKTKNLKTAVISIFFSITGSQTYVFVIVFKIYNYFFVVKIGFFVIKLLGFDFELLVF